METLDTFIFDGERPDGRRKQGKASIDELRGVLVRGVARLRL